MESLKLISFEKWYGFYKLINNKKNFTEEEVATAIIRIKYAVEDFNKDKKNLCNILYEQGIQDNGISEAKSTYTENFRMFIRSSINIEKHNMTNLEFNDCIYNIVNIIVYDNIDIYFNAARLVLTDEEIINIDLLDKNNLNTEINQKILMLLYLFKNSEKEECKVGDIELFLEHSILKSNINSTIIKDSLDILIKKEFILIDWAGNYSIISQNKKELKKLIKYFNLKVTTEEKNNFIFNIISGTFLKFTNVKSKNYRVNLDIDGEKIFIANTNLMLKIDNYTKENRDIRRGYYVVNTRNKENLIFWYGKRILDLDQKAKYIIAYARAVEAIEISLKKDNNGKDFIIEQKLNYKKILEEFKTEIEEGFLNGSYISMGEDKKIGKFKSLEQCFDYIVSILREF
ncbi:MAG: hypothetical protein ACRC57_01265 [Sarcina sp.]